MGTGSDHAAGAAQADVAPHVSVTQDIRDATLVKEGDLFLLADLEGNVPAGNTSGLGLYYRDTRFLSTFDLAMAGLRPTILLSSGRWHFLGTYVLTNPTLVTSEGTHVERETLQIRRYRAVRAVPVGGADVPELQRLPRPLRRRRRHRRRLRRHLRRARLPHRGGPAAGGAGGLRRGGDLPPRRARRAAADDARPLRAAAPEPLGDRGALPPRARGARIAAGVDRKSTSPRTPSPRQGRPRRRDGPPSIARGSSRASRRCRAATRSSTPCSRRRGTNRGRSRAATPRAPSSPPACPGSRRCSAATR